MITSHHNHLGTIYMYIILYIIVLTLIPAVLHLDTASGTLDLGGSISDTNPTKQSPSNGKLTYK